MELLLLSGDVNELAKFTNFEQNATVSNKIGEPRKKYFNCVNYNSQEVTKLGAIFKDELIKSLEFAECFSCHRLMEKDKLKKICLLPVEIENSPVFTELNKFNENRKLSMICKPYCFEFIKANKVPPYSVLNNMNLETSPCELKNLNFYERLLVQKAKCFQTIVQLKPYKRIFSHLTCPALKGN